MTKTCVCGCGRPVVTKAGRYSRRCPNRIPLERRREIGRAIVAARPRSMYQAWGRIGGRASDAKRWATFLERWLSGSPRDAVKAAYRSGYHAGYQAGQASRGRGKSGAA